MFNTNDLSVRIDKFSVVQSNLENLEGYIKEGAEIGYPSDKLANMSTGKNPVVEDFIFNMPSATEVEINIAAGIFLAPNAAVTASGVAGGWIVADTVTTGCEWHFVNGKLPEPGSITANIYAKKTVNNNTPAEGETFWFDLYTYDWGSRTYSSEPLQSAQNDGSLIAFKNINISADDFKNTDENTYAYKVVERAVDDSGYEIDSQERRQRS